ncbi:glycosyltransferase family 4 protein [uncultured Sphingomonas sp.]|uniref:glycosyltransferase family 4 protein n=1 Tax=uncultured Sphingomonas sp. TaxID=158754 RepID=UPI0035CA7F2C
MSTIRPAPLTPLRTIVVVGDLVEGWPPAPGPTPTEAREHWATLDVALRPWPPTPIGQTPVVAGGYLERLALAMVAAGHADGVEIWHHWRGLGPAPFRRESPWLARRAFRLREEGAPMASDDMAAFVEVFGAPHLLLVLGLGIAPELLDRCANGVRVYNSIDAPALRIPPEASAQFDLILTGAQWQSDVVRERHPGMPTAILPIGPEFAAPDQFRPLGTPKDVDLIYVAAAQGYKRHDVLFDALERLPRDVTALCVFGYGEMADGLRARAAASGLSIAFIGPPGVAFDEVNRLMNSARFGVVCGEDDGAPAIITEYMLAGLPVLANERLCCGLQYILPETGRMASAEDFAAAILDMRATAHRYTPRAAVLDRWTWPHSVARLHALISPLVDAKQRQGLACAT